METFHSKYDPSSHLVLAASGSNGYHTTLTPGTPIHDTRHSARYAADLAAIPPDHPHAPFRSRLAPLLSALLKLQDTTPTSLTYGIWPWYAEEPISKMSPPDWNWADFIGSNLAVTLRHLTEPYNRGLISPALLSETQEALVHAAYSIFRRNIRSHYTNIAVMGAVVCAAAGEMLHEPRLLLYARQRFSDFIAHTAHHGDFNEYNSPIYTPVVIEECDRGLFLIQDADCRTALQAIHRHAWGIVADYYHPTLKRWASPISRTYDDRLTNHPFQVLSSRTPLRLFDEIPPAAAGDASSIPPTAKAVESVPLLPPPPDSLAKLTNPSVQPHQIVRRFEKKSPPLIDITGSTYMGRLSFLGSVSRGSLWTQSRPLMATWQNPDLSRSSLRLRMLKDARDFSSAMVHAVQHNHPDASASLVLAAVNFFSDKGDYHIHLDRPASGIFQLDSLSLALQLLHYPPSDLARSDIRPASPASFTPVSDSGWVYRSGPVSLAVSLAPACHFGPTPIGFSILPGSPASDSTQVPYTADVPPVATLSASLMQGHKLSFNPLTLGPTRIVFAIALSEDPARPAQPPAIAISNQSAESFTATCHNLTLTAPLLVQPY